MMWKVLDDFIASFHVNGQTSVCYWNFSTIYVQDMVNCKASSWSVPRDDIMNTTEFD
jgi:hypothetical protein